ncbi:hypothetical protein GUITHDRAFT_152817 [Guillardia theta CCMP2712]|uniref:Mediator of RNA polymerase II transcription subunit 21 n=1 Tax=Guillardia theta (strain CCMP2712) TaxID=905079 RepID=L1J9J7_GUITC|nr:hypothetical protein GUITHDRAFT_152817 [Guillardia theta CCMP2712]EKX44997.1 hypothetical protein GUITHDRAFT_152817 [Guillardia theta CCMP2712]|eukprot:XP_005831977.1 hypothetical protein GUITHDRAFT_152817 [Guillardia theta CCMP2712]
MDVYNQLQEKLNDITHRFAHEARYFQLCAPPEALSGEEVHEAPSKPPFEETKESLLEPLNVQVEQLLGTLPADDVGEQEQLAVLEELIRENKEAGNAIREERARVKDLLGHVQCAMVDVCDRSGQGESLASCELWLPRPRPELAAQPLVKAEEMDGAGDKSVPEAAGNDAAKSGEEQTSAPVVKMETSE